MLKKKTIIILIVSLIVIISVIVGTSLAVWQSATVQNTTNVISTVSCLSISIQSESDPIALTNQYPKRDDKGMAQAPYTFTITNNCNKFMEVDLGFEALTTTTVPHYRIKGLLTRSGEVHSTDVLTTYPEGEALNGGTTYVLLTDTLPANGEKTYDYRMWIDYSATEAEAENKAVYGKIIVTGRIKTEYEPVVASYPASWATAQSGSLLYGIKATNLIGAAWTQPGKQITYSGNLAQTSIIVSNVSLSSLYWTYATGYELDASTGKFNLTGVQTAKGNAVPGGLTGKYIVGTTESANTGSSTTPKTTTGLTNLYKVVSVTAQGTMNRSINFITEASWSAVGSSYQNYYWTYGTGVEADTVNGTSSTMKFNLTNVKLAQYSSVYHELPGKYIVGTTYSANSNSGSTLKTTTNLSNVYQVVATGTDYFIYTKPSEKVLSTGEDDYGTTYYFRGAVDNNYLVFANMCWRIVRVTGDGSIKLILYNYNPNNVENPCATSQNHDNYAFARYSGTTYTSAFNTNGNNAYIGYMYGSTSGSTYEATHTNTNDSTILTNLKTWYDLVFTTNQKNMLSDVIWCNDKSLSSTTTGTGIGTSSTEYGGYERLRTPASANPTLICPDATTTNPTYTNISRFTAADTVRGNGALNGYKIGLLTADEAAFAGMIYETQNTNCYLRGNTGSAYNWYTLTPSQYNFVYFVSYHYLRATTAINSAQAVRPAIALKPTTMIKSGGLGTQSKPFVVVE